MLSCRVLYFDRGSGQEVTGKVVAVDYTVDPPSYAVFISSLDTTRETVASRLKHAHQVPTPCLLLLPPLPASHSRFT